MASDLGLHGFLLIHGPVVQLFVCVEVLGPSQPNGVMSSMVSLPDNTFTGQAWSSKRLTSPSCSKLTTSLVNDSLKF